MEITNYKGCIKLIGVTINEIANKWIKLYNNSNFERSLINREKRDESKDFHLTVITAKEKVNFQHTETSHDIKIFDLGIGSQSRNGQTTWYVVIQSPYIEAVRKKHKLQPIDLHITLGFTHTDLHNVSKNISSLCYKQEYNQTLHKILLENPNNEIANALMNENYLAGLYFVAKIKAKDDSIKQTYFFLLEEIQKNNYMQLNYNEEYDIKILKILNQLSWKNNYDKFVKYYTCKLINNEYSFQIHDMPRNFTFVTNKLVGTSIPKEDQDFNAFVEMGVTDVITLMETPLDKKLYENKKLRYHFFEVDDRTPPTKEQVLDIVQIIDTSKIVVVHCLGGVGRTATVIIAYLMWNEKISKSDAKTRLINRKTILSKSQEEFLTDWYGVCRQQILKVKLPPIIMMVGYPASGKSTFSQAVVDCSSTITRINQDNIGKKECEILAGKTSIKNTSILDRCNLTKEERKTWLSLMHNRKAWCIYYTVPWEECRWRITRRENHPTIKKGGVKILEGIRDKLEPPTKDEGFEKIFELKNMDIANKLLEEWGVPIPESPSFAEHSIIKFPRTRHVVNLGAATRDDLIMSQAEQNQYLNKFIYIEEKVDGANLGISINNNKIYLQNRSHYITSTYHDQFKLIDKWIYKHTEELWGILEPDRHILYGEWLYAKHSIPYQNLPDWFMAFDIFDQFEGKFYSRDRLEKTLANTSIKIVPVMEYKFFKNVNEFKQIIQRPSQFYEGRVEGVYLRVCDDQWLLNRGKIVRTDFLSGNKHWSSGKIEQNQILNGSFYI